MYLNPCYFLVLLKEFSKVAITRVSGYHEEYVRGHLTIPQSDRQATTSPRDYSQQYSTLKIYFNSI